MLTQVSIFNLWNFFQIVSTLKANAQKYRTSSAPSGTSERWGNNLLDGIFALFCFFELITRNGPRQGHLFHCFVMSRCWVRCTQWMVWSAQFHSSKQPPPTHKKTLRSPWDRFKEGGGATNSGQGKQWEKTVLQLGHKIGQKGDVYRAVKTRNARESWIALPEDMKNFSWITRTHTCW